MNIFKNTSINEYLEGTYKRKGATRSYKKFCEKVGDIIGGEKNLVSVGYYEGSLPALPIKPMGCYAIKIKDKEKVQISEGEMKFICQECFLFLDGETVVAACDDIMNEIFDIWIRTQD